MKCISLCFAVFELQLPFTADALLRLLENADEGTTGFEWPETLYTTTQQL